MGIQWGAWLNGNNFGAECMPAHSSGRNNNYIMTYYNTTSDHFLSLKCEQLQWSNSRRSRRNQSTDEKGNMAKIPR
ncbi:Uncharacterized protein APZ42_026189 [Daphnia magna]|uniref:Uncharacterized protein n=1 Tax=Daphnia magna TaxID=35525 RepID=A0A162EDV2_9CRUS|nr:Uncharacterized protein APZ42_026189 [Daphnia magna]